MVPGTQGQGRQLPTFAVATAEAAEVSSWQYANGTGQPWLRSKVGSAV